MDIQKITNEVKGKTVKSKEEELLEWSLNISDVKNIINLIDKSSINVSDKVAKKGMKVSYSDENNKDIIKEISSIYLEGVKRHIEDNLRELRYNISGMRENIKMINDLKDCCSEDSISLNNSLVDNVYNSYNLKNVALDGFLVINEGFPLLIKENVYIEFNIPNGNIYTVYDFLYVEKKKVELNIKLIDRYSDIIYNVYKNM